MAMTLTKNKNYLVFTNADNRTYKFDINKGVFLSTRGTPMKTTPVGFATYLNGHYTTLDSCVLRYMYNLHTINQVAYCKMNDYIHFLGICDRLDSIGYKPHNWWYRLYDETLEFIDQNFKAFAKAFREDNSLSLDDFRNSYGKEAFFIEMGIANNEHYTDDMKEYIWNVRDNFTQGELKLVAYYLAKGVYDFYADDRHRHWNIPTSIFTDFFKWSAMVEYEPTKDDFFKQYIKIKRTYRTHQQEFDSKAIAYQLDKHKETWDFSDDEYVVVVPKSTADFENEANQQNNCVYNMYMERVIKGNTNVVFIRKKDNIERSHITCEVDNNGHIRQYLLKHNNYVQKGSSEDEFYKKFDAHIMATWH